MTAVVMIASRSSNRVLSGAAAMPWGGFVALVLDLKLVCISIEHGQ